LEPASESVPTPQYKDELSIIHKAVSSDVHSNQFPFSIQTLLSAISSLDSSQSLSLLTYNDLKSLILLIGSYAFKTRPDNFRSTDMPIKMVTWLPDLVPSVNERCWSLLIKLIAAKQHFQDPLESEDIFWISFHDCLRFETTDSAEMKREPFHSLSGAQNDLSFS
jgi:hypothetical protein